VSQNENGWLKVRFGDIAVKLNENVDPVEDGVERYVAGEHMVTDQSKINEWGTVGDSYLGPAFHRKFSKGDILYGSRRTYLRKVAVADFDGVCSNTTFVVNPNPDLIVPELLYWIMKMDSFNKFSIANSRGSTNPYINWSQLVDFELSLPPIEKQKEIAELLWEAENSIELLEKTIISLENSFDSVINHLVYGNNLDLNENLDSGVINSWLQKVKLVPKKWEVVPFSEIIELVKGVSYQSKDYSEDDDANIFITIKCFEKRGGFNPKGIKYIKKHVINEVPLETGDLLISNTDLTRKGEIVGYPVIIPNLNENKKLIYSMDCSLLRAKNENVILKYYYYYLRAHGNHNRIKALAAGSTVLHLDIKWVNKLKVLFPPIEEQKRIAAVCEAMESRINFLKAQKNNYMTLKASLIETLLDGDVTEN